MKYSSSSWLVEISFLGNCTKDEAFSSTSLCTVFAYIALELALLPPSQTLEKLRTLDPFDVRTFDTELTVKETKLQRSLEKEELKELRTCPNDGEYITKEVIQSGPCQMKQKSFIQRVQDDNNNKQRVPDDDKNDDEDDVVSL